MSTIKKRFSAEQTKHHVFNQQESGLSIQQYCRANQITPSSFYNWRVKHHATTKAKTTGTKKPIINTAVDNWLPVEPSDTCNQPSSHLSSIHQPEQQAQPALVKLSLPGGFLLEIRAG